jgi:hypothetical protein
MFFFCSLVNPLQAALCTPAPITKPLLNASLLSEMMSPPRAAREDRSGADGC